MTREDKIEIVKELSTKLGSCSHFYIADSSGLSVAEVNKFRRVCYSKGLEYRLVKNTLIKKALDTLATDTSALEGALKGTSGIIFSDEVSNAPAKAIKEFRKEGNEKPILKAAYIDSDIFVGDENLNMLSDLKSKGELIGEVISLLQSPAKNVISALQSGKDTLGGIVKTLSER